MLRMLRKNVLIDFGPVVNTLGAKLIETPDVYKRVNNIGEIMSVGSRCSRLGSSDIGKKCVVNVIKDMEMRLPPAACEKAGLKRHWHFIVHESRIQVLLEK